MASPPHRKLITVVCPIFNEEQTIPLFYERLQSVLGRLRPRYDFELLFTNNGSQDGTVPMVREIRERGGR